MSARACGCDRNVKRDSDIFNNNLLSDCRIVVAAAIVAAGTQEVADNYR
jgi:hypothetical protein